jgi:hypothetical protein
MVTGLETRYEVADRELMARNRGSGSSRPTLLWI